MKKITISPRVYICLTFVGWKGLQWAVFLHPACRRKGCQTLLHGLGKRNKISNYEELHLAVPTKNSELLFLLGSRLLPLLLSHLCCCSLIQYMSTLAFLRCFNSSSNGDNGLNHFLPRVNFEEGRRVLGILTCIHRQFQKGSRLATFENNFEVLKCPSFEILQYRLKLDLALVITPQI